MNFVHRLVQILTIRHSLQSRINKDARDGIILS